MVAETQQARAVALRALHESGVLVLPNAWDAGSAALIAAAGAKAVATTSGGVSWSLGRPDGHGLTRDEMVEAVRRIVSVVDVPVTADVEGGYGESPEDVAKTVEAIIGAGAVGVNVEDSKAPGGPLFDASEQAARLRAGRDAAAKAGLPELVINVRTDVFLFGIGEEAGRLDDVIERAGVYAEAGADSLFVPGLIDLDALTTLVKAVPVPVNVMTWPGAPTIAEFEAAGVRRVSLGTAVSQAAYTVAKRATEELLATGTYGALEDALDFGTINSAVS
ncbi:isocitrate lyase/phosphoenolpyruvate mutase family protein [Amycolatopsis mongoliensis]|uniref:Isocitrate lyase/phosphoenolpyruvate mutase family protein n=1 Tax=Amycolatopsis mongoliensis TaxID=715475 RepID=A0A9Y2JW39_9PSEU|nr:isocitrate lyase/phosphoenolpyruvate mutase family protein [Amycolatopsis sp. 4-36]WIY05750.1 isocitrate lyase/phosphoenolpyruvate mutase family protein [Amycolatopsis sp. 4-36]